jgi:toxin-antitoxin system PIN domain toxin
MFAVDTNILVYAADEESPFHRPCYDSLETWRRQASAWYVTWGILYEFLRVVTHSRVFRSPWEARQAWAFVEGLLDSPSLGILIPTERHSDVVSEVMMEVPHLHGNLMHDLHTAVLMREHGISRIYTRDMDFHRFPFVQPEDPITPKSLRISK